MNYHKFAYLYDQLMQEAPYDEWVSLIMTILNQNGITKGTLLDVGCGTGNIAIPLSKKGYSVTGVDLSEEMLFVAAEKVNAENVNLPLFQQDMRTLEGLGMFDAIVSLCDTLNYLESEEDVQNTFQSLYDHLREKGILIFDVHSTYKINHVFSNQTYAYSGEELAYIWECYNGEHPNSIEHELSFFIQNEKKHYERYDELHKQRTFPVAFYTSMLEKAGFDLLSVTGDFSTKSLEENSERWFFVATKHKKS